MGSTESTLPAMEEPEQEPEIVEAPEVAEVPVSLSRPTHRRPRRRRHTTSATTDLSRGSVIIGGIDDPWWWEVENENLVLDQGPQMNASIPSADSVRGNASELSDDFNTLLKIGENVNATLNNNSNISENNVGTMVCTSESVRNSSERIDYSKHNTSGDLAESNVAGNREQTLAEFKEELRIKRLARQTAVQDLRDEITTLRQQLSTEKALTRRLCHAESTGDETDFAAAGAICKIPVSMEIDTDDEDPKSRGRHANIELANAQLALQLANSDNLSLRTELGVVHKQVGTLKEVIACCKQMLVVKEEQCTQLKSKLEEIETSFAEREMRIMSDSLRQEYERQLNNIRQLRQLYEERQRVSAAEHENLQRLISIKKDELLAEQEKTTIFEERNQALLKEVENTNNELAAMRDECSEHKFEKRALKEEMGAVNTLFSQMVMGFNGKNNLDIDRLTMMLEENRTLLNDMATKEVNCSDGATLPKLLFELVEQATLGNKLSRSSTPIPAVAEEDDMDEEEKVKLEELDEYAAEQRATTDDALIHDNDDDMEEHETADEAASAADVCEVTRHVASSEAELQPENTTDSQTMEELGAVGVAPCLGTAMKANKSVKKNHRKNTSNANNTAVVPAATAGAMRKQAAVTTMLKFHEPEIIGKVASAQEIIGNLPKVWKVLMELLSHHQIEQVQFEENGNAEDCYKSVETPNGPKAELSVSKTYIKLKDLILEKKSLVKETNRLKTLNSHLEYRLNEQEKRLSTVSLELTKTWHLVGKMQRQHRQLHTQEQILRYQLQQKRRLLTELKDELEYCRRKWAAARAKNDETQEQWNDLRREFAKRKLDDANNSAESGYSDSGPASDEEERAAAAAVAAETTDDVVAAGSSGSSSSACSRRKHFRELFEHTRKIKRMQSSSPGRAAAEAAGVELVLRWNSAPPTCGWRRGTDVGGGEFEELPPRVLVANSSGAATKPRSSRSEKRGTPDPAQGPGEEEEELPTACGNAGEGEQGDKCTSRIQRLEEQCKSLIQQVLETSDNRERLEVQLCRFQDAIAPVQYAVPLDEYINRKRMVRASSAPVAGTLTPREEEYTRRRSERLERLEEESRQLMTRIKRTSDRGNHLRSSLDRIRRAPSREGSCESNTEEEASKSEEHTEQEAAVAQAAHTDATENVSQEPQASVEVSVDSTEKNALTAEEQAYTARRAARLQRLEEESKQLLTSLTRNTQRGETLGSRLDTLHERYACEESAPESSAGVDAAAAAKPRSATTIEQRLEDIEKISTNRAERLRLLEEEGKQLLSRLSNTSERGTKMINRIAKRELNRQARLSATPSRDTDAEADDNGDGAAAAADRAEQSTALLLPIKNVACSSIVDEELKECVTVTTTPSRIATQQGAVPKSMPTAQLCAARPKAARRAPTVQPSSSKSESLEEMVKRLQKLPFPTEEEIKAGEEQEQQKEEGQ